ncbi:MAG: succinate dehydrogenase, hydrophobic membrane anchor protein [Erythrobacter sp.]|nr:MAG: succinate dehydrogenase, hydrophobic membrane anchor protein [Erythrobacter sp.]
MGRRTSLEPFGGKGTAIGHVRGLGSAHHGAHHWLLQRFTAVGNLVLIGFLVISFLLLPDLSYATARDWVSQPVPALALALIMVNTFWHARLGVQIMLEDYVDTPGNKFAAVLLLNVAIFAGSAFGLFSLARLVFGGAA